MFFSYIINLFNYSDNIVNFYKKNNIDIEELELRRMISLYLVTT